MYCTGSYLPSGQHQLLMVMISQTRTNLVAKEEFMHGEDPEVTVQWMHASNSYANIHVQVRVHNSCWLSKEMYTQTYV